MLQFEQATRPQRRVSVLEGAEGSATMLSRSELDWEKAHLNLGRILRALERLDSFATMGQRLLHDEGEEPSRFDLLGLLESVDADLAALRRLSESGHRRRLVFSEAFACCDALWVWAPRSDVMALLGRIFTYQAEELIPVRLLAHNEGRVQLEFGLSLPKQDAGGWSLAGERLKLRSWGGDFSWSEASCTLSLPLVGAEDCPEA